MKTKYIFILCSLMSVSLTSCGQVLDYSTHLDDYVTVMNYRDGFNILQLTDIHWSNNSSTMSSKIYLNKVFTEVVNHVDKIDLVEISGDLFMLANYYHITTFINYFEAKAVEYGFKYAVIWGNHDHHGLYNPNYLSKEFARANHSIYIDLEDNLYGRSNFVINLKKDEQVKWQITNLDSGACFSETAIDAFRNYDYIRQDQTDWWVLEHQKVGETVPNITYYHIPQQDNQRLWDEIHNNGATYKNKFFKLEEFDSSEGEEYASNFIETAKLHNLKGAFMGHAHNVDWTVDYDGVTIGLGVKTGTELYFAHVDASSDDPAVQEGLASTGITENFDLIGASLVTLKDETGNFDLEHLYLNERVNGDFIKWVKY